MSTPGSAVRPAMQQQTTTTDVCPLSVGSLAADKENHTRRSFACVNTVLSRATYSTRLPRGRVSSRHAESAAPYRTCPRPRHLRHNLFINHPHCAPHPRHLMTAKSRAARGIVQLSVHLSRSSSIRVLSPRNETLRSVPFASYRHNAWVPPHCGTRASHACAIPHQCTPLVGAHLTWLRNSLSRFGTNGGGMRRAWNASQSKPS